MHTTSKFWAGGSASSSSESDTSGSEDEGIEATKIATQVIPARWAAESSSSEDEKRIVKSAKDRHFQVMRDVIRQIQNHQRICDYAEIARDYETLLKSLTKAKQTVEREGIPKFFIRALQELDSFVEDKYRDRAAFKKLSKPKATALNTLRAKVRKCNEEFKEAIEKCKEIPDNFLTSDSSEEEEEEEESSEEEKGNTAQSDSDEELKAGRGRSGSDWSSSGSSVSSKEGHDEEVGRHDRAVQKWGIKEEKTKSKKMYPSISSSKNKPLKKSSTVHTTGLMDDDEAAPLTTKDVNMLLDASDLSLDIIRGRVKLLAERRGRRGVEKMQQSKIFKKLADLAKSHGGDRTYLEVMGHLMVAEFDAGAGPHCLTSIAWVEVADHLNECITILTNNPTYAISTTLQNPEEETTPEAKEIESLACITHLSEKLDVELTKSLQFTDVHSEEYRDRLGQSINLLFILWRIYYFLNGKKSSENAAAVALRISEHMHYKHDSIASKVWEAVKQKCEEEICGNLPTFSADNPTGKKPSELIRELASFVFQHGGKRDKLRALLHLGYICSIHDSYIEAREWVLTPNIHEIVLTADVSSQILYNRNLVQLGLCAFRKGCITDAHTCLSEVCALNKHKELLAQGLSSLKNQDKLPDQDRAEKRRLLPYHMHISLELIECAHNICAMLLEVPTMAAAAAMVSNMEVAQKLKKPISRHFRRLLELYKKQVFLGPPENARETVMAATKCLQKGNWKECSALIFSLGIWDKMQQPEEVKANLFARIKKEAMKTYMFTFSKLYASFSVTQLSQMFEIANNIVHSTVSKMMMKEELLASWDESSQFIIIDRVETTRLQQNCMTLATSVAQAVEQNELTVNMKNPKFALTLDRRTYQKEERTWVPHYDYRQSDRISGMHVDRWQQRYKEGGRSLFPIHQKSAAHRTNYKPNYQNKNRYEHRPYDRDHKIHTHHEDGNWQGRGGWETKAEGYGNNKQRWGDNHD